LPDAESRYLFRQALAAAVEFAENPMGWLVLTGPSGSGKTHLAVAVANRCIERGQTTLFIVVADLLDHLRAAYSPDSPVSYDELFDQVRNAPVLALDDLGTQSTTPWAQEKLFQVINHRFNSALPTVITIRGSLSRLDEGLRTRMEASDGVARVFRLGQYNTRLARRIGDIPAEMQQRMTFANFDPRGRRDATAEEQESLEQGKKAAQTFAAEPDGWLVFSGTHGCGKTHLAVAIAGERLRQGSPVFFAFVPSLLDHLRATFSPDSPIGYDELFEHIKTVPLLILDDLGAESSTPWAEEKLYQIVVHRHEARLPTVITTSFTSRELEEAKPRIASRLVDSMVVDWETITAPNYRDQRRDTSGSGTAGGRPSRGRQGPRRP
jgi:DNA replication protein DnaC